MRPIGYLLGFIVAISVAGTAFYLLRPAPPVSSLTATTPPPPPPPAAGETPPKGERARVLWISDGDTITASPIEGEYEGREQRIRLIGLDAPEMHPKPECWARRSTDALAELVPKGSTITMTFDSKKFDDFKRQLRYIWNSSGLFVNSEQLKQGNGHLLRIWPNVRHEKLFKADVEQARANHKGLWGGCQDPKPPVHS